MENKTASVKREILRSIIERYGNKGRKIIIQKAKDSGVYKDFEDDNEIYSLVLKFSKFHNLHIEPEKELKEEDIHIEEILSNSYPDETEEERLYKILQHEHDRLSKKLLALNKFMELYKPE